MTNREELKARLLKVDSDPIGCDLSSNSYRNPDGPEAAARIEQLEAEIARLRDGLEPFIAAAEIGVATYEAVKAAKLPSKGLSSYETVYISAGVYAAESRMSFKDWERLALLKGQGK